MAVYKKNYLNSVVVRLDIEPVELGPLSSFLKSIEKDFPVSEQKEGQEGSLVLDMKTGQTQQTHAKKVFWQVSDKDENRVITIDTKFIHIQYKKYKDSTFLLKDVENVLGNFIKTFKVETIKRVGLRYSNKIELPKENDPLKWDKYLNKNLIANLAYVAENGLEISRMLGQISVRKEDAYITFNYGIGNDDFPNEIVNKQFVLDFDCVSKFPLETSSLNIVSLIKTYNKYVEDLFEASITDGLRTLMKK